MTDVFALWGEICTCLESIIVAKCLSLKMYNFSFDTNNRIETKKLTFLISGRTFHNRRDVLVISDVLSQGQLNKLRV